MASNKSNGLELADWARAPVDAGPLWQRFLKAIYNPQEKSFLGRTPKRWAIVLVFYGIFYVVLALMFAICMGGLKLSLDERRPSYLLEKSLIGVNPGVAFRPQSTDGIRIHYRRGNDTHYAKYVEQLDEFLKPYQAEGEACTIHDNYGYPDSPCIFVKLNKIYGWEPEYLDAASLPADMPAELVDHIKGVDAAKHQQIWVSCEEEKKKGEEQNSSSTIAYPWGRGFGSLFYPFMNQPGYRSPLVAVQVTVPLNKVTAIRCRVWAKNIIYNKSLKEPSGYTRVEFEILEDPNE